MRHCASSSVICCDTDIFLSFDSSTRFKMLLSEDVQVCSMSYRDYITRSDVISVVKLKPQSLCYTLN